MKRAAQQWVWLIFCLAACGAPTATPTPQVINVHATTAAQPWLTKVYSCAEAQTLVIRLSTPATADLRLRLGEPENLTTPAFQIGSENLLVVTSPGTGLAPLNANQLRELFSRPQGGQPLEIWVYSPGEDLQQVFAREILRGAPVSSLARLATSPQYLANHLAQSPSAIGFLPEPANPTGLQEVYRLPEVPVLALTQSEPQGSLKNLLACLQEKTAP
jgi:hypothetical protein